MCAINDNYMMYGSWDIKCDRQNLLSFWIIFAPLQTKNFLKETPWRYHHFTQMGQKSWSYATLFLRNNAWQILFLFFILGHLRTQKIKILKEWKNRLVISWFDTCVHYDHMITVHTMITVPEIWGTTGGRTDGRTENVTLEVGAPPNKRGTFYNESVLKISTYSIQTIFNRFFKGFISK